MILPDIVLTYLDAYNRGDVDVLVDCVAETIVFENVSNSGYSITTEGRAAFADLARKASSMFASRRQSVRRAVVDGDTVALEIDWVGTPLVDIGPMTAGVEAHIRGASFITIADGKLTHVLDIS